jgi:hypothetical protein
MYIFIIKHNYYKIFIRKVFGRHVVLYKIDPLMDQKNSSSQRFRKRWPESRLDCKTCARKFSARYTERRRSRPKRIRHRITERIKIGRIGRNGSRLTLTDFDPDKDSGVYRCFAQREATDADGSRRSVGGWDGSACPDRSRVLQPVYIEAEVRSAIFSDVKKWNP